MAGNDIDYILNVIYEKFVENQKNKKHEERVNMGKDEFINDLKDFVKKSKIQDKNLLIAEIYRSVSKDSLEISSDGKITVSPKILKKVEKQILEKKEREEQLNKIQENLEAVSILDITHELYMELSEEEKLELFTDAVSSLTRSLGLELTQEEIEDIYASWDNNFSTDKDELDRKRIENENRLFGSEKTENPIKDQQQEVYTEAWEKRTELLTGTFGKIFVQDGKIDKEFFTRMAKELNNNDVKDIRWIINKVCKECGYDEEKTLSILRGLNGFETAKDLKDQMVLFISMDSLIRDFEEMDLEMQGASLSDYDQRKKDVIDLKEAIASGDVKRIFEVKRLLSEKRTKSEIRDIIIKGVKEQKKSDVYLEQEAEEIENLGEIEKHPGKVLYVNKKSSRLNAMKKKESLSERGVKRIPNGKIKLKKNEISEARDEALKNARLERVELGTETNVNKKIKDSELKVLSNRVEELHVNQSVKGVNPVTVEVEKINVPQNDKTVKQEEVIPEEQTRKEDGNTNNYLKKITWLDEVKQRIINFGKKIGGIVKSDKNKDKLKGLFNKNEETLNEDLASDTDNTSASESSNSSGEKTKQVPIDFLNTKFEVDPKQAVQNAKEAASKKEQKKEMAEEIEQDERS